MYLHFFLLLFSSGISSYFLSPKETLYLEKKVQCAIIEEMVCLLKAEHGPRNMTFIIPCHIMEDECACSNTKIFIEGLNQMNKYQCMRKVKVKMEKLQNNCSILEQLEGPPSHCKCTMKVKQFFHFKKHLEEFLKWVNENKNCSNIIRNNSGLYQDGKCTCPKP